MDELERARKEARAEAFDDAAYIVKNAWKHGAKCETEQDWLTMSYTFSNQAVLIRRAIAEHAPPAPSKDSGE
jgi:hypothetical protein